MTQNDYIVYIFWAALPGIQAIYLAYLSLELVSKKVPKTTVSDACRNLMFLCLCLIAASIIDLYFLKYGINFINEALDLIGLQLPEIFFRLITYPAVLVIGGKFFKSTKPLEPPKNQILKYNRDKIGKK
jgi:hypothetical protein